MQITKSQSHTATTDAAVAIGRPRSAAKRTYRHGNRLVPQHAAEYQAGLITRSSVPGCYHLTYLSSGQFSLSASTMVVDDCLMNMVMACEPLIPPGNSRRGGQRCSTFFTHIQFALSARARRYDLRYIAPVLQSRKDGMTSLVSM